MPFWRKKNDDFEWHKYVRTTILQRREQRRHHVDKAKKVAVDGIKAASVAAVVGSRDGSRVVSHGLGWLMGAVLRGLRAVAETVSRWVGLVVGALVQSLKLGARSISHLGGPTLRAISRPLGPLWDVLGRPAVSLTFAVIGAIALAAAAIRMWQFGVDRDVWIAACIGIVLLLGVVLAKLAKGGGPRIPPWLRPWLPRIQGQYIAAGLAIAVAAVAAWAFISPGVQLASILPSLPFASSKPIEGRAVVVSAEVVRLGNQAIRLAGIEAPESQQRCALRGRRTWSCGRSAEHALQRLTSGKQLQCDLSGSDEAGRPLGVCRQGGMDINAQLVKEGHVFASEGLLARYASQQEEAQRQKLGLWKGEAERPSSYRAKRWDEAKRKAPDGCPIKGRVLSRAKVYVLPWSPEYDDVQIRTARGERWFCTEQEAVGAGWRAAERS